MSELPNNNNLPINLLAACFNNTTATYKFYWLLSIVQSVEKGKLKINKKELFSRMISNAWFTVNYFHISFGKQDKLQRAIEIIKEIESLTIDEEREKIFNTLLNTSKDITLRQLKYFDSQVPHWFLSPWFPKLDKAAIYRASQDFKETCLYSLNGDAIIINPQWAGYISENARLLKDFCFWGLTMFLQAKNPNVPDLPNKLIKAAKRNSLIKQRTLFWDLVLRENGRIECIYTHNQLTIDNYAVEHFIPYNFVSHDLIWNLIPADKAFNSKKSDKLPPIDKYFSPFYSLQEKAISIVREKEPRNKFLEDYLTIFPDLNELNSLHTNFTKKKFKNIIQPLITIAANNGFEFLK